MLASLLVSRAVAFALVLGRISGFVAVSPFPGTYVETTPRVGLVVVLSVVVTAFAPSGAPDGLGIGVAMLGPAAIEIGCGLAMGLAFRFVMAAFDVAGSVMAQSVGLAAATTYDPGAEAQTSPLEQIVTLLAISVALAVGVHRVALAYLLESFRAMPVGGALHLAASTSTFVDLSAEALKAGVRLAMPVLGIGLVVQVALALLARAAPSMQIFNVGLTVLLATGLLVILTTLDSFGAGMAAHLGTLGPTLDRVLLALREASP